MIEPRILALGDELQKRGFDSTAAMLAGLFVLLGSDFAQSVAMLRRAAEVSGEDASAIETAVRAIEEQAGRPYMRLGIALQKTLERTG